jgi:hypothetical protein
MAQIVISSLPPLPNLTGSAVPKGTDLSPATDITDTTVNATGKTNKYTRADELNFVLTSLGLTTYTAALVATTVALTASYSNGTAGVGATLTNSGAIAALVIDGVSVAVGNRVLVKDQVSTAENGIYVVTVVGSDSINWVLTRATDFDTAEEVEQYGVVLVNQGSVSAGLVYQESAAGSFTIGTSPITFVAYSTISSINSESGLVNSGTSQQVAYYSSTGNAVSGLTISNNSVLSANNSGNLASLEYTSTATASKLVQRDANNNIFSNNNILNQTTVSAGGSTTLTVTSANTQIISGSGATTFILPNATTLQVGFSFNFNNNTASLVSIYKNDGATLVVAMPAGQYLQMYNTNASTSNGTWDYHWLVPTNMANGQVMIGNTTGGPKAANLTAGTGITITNAANSITISSTGSGIGWTEVTGTTQTIVADAGYVANNASLVTFTLPATAAFGTAINIIGKGAGGWAIAQLASQSIRFGSVSTTVGVGGSLSSTNAYDSITLICTTANTTWTMLSAPQGTLTIV